MSQKSAYLRVFSDYLGSLLSVSFHKYTIHVYLLLKLCHVKRWKENLNNRFRKLRQGHKILLLTAPRSALWPTKHPIHWMPASLSPGIKRPQRHGAHFLHVVGGSEFVELPTPAFVAWLTAGSTFVSIHSVYLQTSMLEKENGFGLEPSLNVEVRGKHRH
jgi:hypothetical protein